MLSNRPYLLRAFHQWIIDSNCTPILVLDATNPRCKIPQDYAEGGEIVFNISSIAVRDLKISNELVEFKASFSGVIHLISAPMKAVLAIYAEENGEGLFFDAEEDESGEGEIKNEVIPLKSIEGGSSTRLKEEVHADGPKQKPFLKLVE